MFLYINTRKIKKKIYSRKQRHQKDFAFLYSNIQKSVPTVAEDMFSVRETAAIVVGERTPDLLERIMLVVSGETAINGQDIVYYDNEVNGSITQ